MITNFLSISFVVETEDSELPIANTMKEILPRIGEYIWMPYNWDKKSEFKTRSFIVEEIAHHISPDSNIPYDSIIIYCKPVIPKE